MVCSENHLESQFLGDKEGGVQTGRTLVGTSSYIALLYTIKPQNVNQPSQDECLVKAMDEELDQIEKNHTWELVQRPHDKNDGDKMGIQKQTKSKWRGN